jgi:suppressor of ftsI
MPIVHLLLAVAVAATAVPLSAQEPNAPPPCGSDPARHAMLGVPSPDMHCVRLEGGAATPEAYGWVRLLPAPTPFGIAVDPDGVVQYRFEVHSTRLPAPEELGAYDRYVAWITPPGLHPMVRLGEVESGRPLAGVGGFNQYLFLVSAERSGPPGDAPTGPLVLRGSSPSMVLRPHDLPFILAEMTPQTGEGTGHGAHDHHDAVQGHRAHGVELGALPEGPVEHWRPPPMHPQVSMPEQIMGLRPQVSPFLPIPEDPGDLEAARASVPHRLADGDTLVVEAGPVLRRMGGLELPGYAFNGQIPGPRIEARAGSTIHVLFRNRTPLPSAVHWHGLRLDWPFDGVPGVTQDPVPPGGDFHYELRVPDEGTFWYHPHLREDVMQDMGMAGNLRIHPDGEGLYDPVDAEEYLVLDDHLVGPEGPVPYGREAPIHALMGRFGNVLLVNGRTDWHLEARPGETIRLHLTNAAATRTFNLSARVPEPSGGAVAEGTLLPLRLVGSDVGALPRSTRTRNVVIAPAERWVVELHLPASLPEGSRVQLENRVQALDHMGARFFPQVDTLGAIQVTGTSSPEASDRARTAAAERSNQAMVSHVEAVMERHLAREPDRTLILDLEVDGLPFPIDPLLNFEGAFRAPVEWEGTMMDMDWLATGGAVQWILRDPASGAENMEVDWRFQRGDRVKLRLVNDRDSAHPMQHPIHLHGQRFLVLAVNGEPNEHPAWKDTVLVPVGAVVDLLVEMDNPGPWMLHCHISEHLETGMMTVIHVEDVPY